MIIESRKQNSQYSISIKSRQDPFLKADLSIC